MDYRVQAMAGVLVLEDQLAQAFAVDAPVADILRSELAHHRVEAWASRGVYLVAGLVGVDDGRTELAKHLGHGRLPRPRAAGQPNELQFA